MNLAKRVFINSGGTNTEKIVWKTQDISVICVWHPRHFRYFCWSWQFHERRCNSRDTQDCGLRYQIVHYFGPLPAFRLLSSNAQSLPTPIMYVALRTQLVGYQKVQLQRVCAYLCQSPLQRLRSRTRALRRVCYGAARRVSRRFTRCSIEEVASGALEKRSLPV